VCQRSVQRLVDELEYWMGNALLAAEEHLPLAVSAETGEMVCRGDNARLELAWRLQQGGRGANQWLTAIPRHPEDDIPHELFASTLGARVGLQHARVVGHCACGRGEVSRAHLLACRTTLRNARHDVVVREILRWSKALGMSSRKEVWLDGGEGRVDLTVDLGGETVSLDVTIVHADLSTKVGGWERRLGTQLLEIPLAHVPAVVSAFIRGSVEVVQPQDPALRRATTSTTTATAPAAAAPRVTTSTRTTTTATTVATWEPAGAPALQEQPPPAATVAASAATTTTATAPSSTVLHHPTPPVDDSATNIVVAQPSPTFNARTGKVTVEDPLGLLTALKKAARNKTSKYGEAVTVRVRGHPARTTRFVPFVVSAGGMLGEDAIAVVNEIAFSQKSRHRVTMRGEKPGVARQLLLRYVGQRVIVGNALLLKTPMEEGET
jgi:hypothetical protein